MAAVQSCCNTTHTHIPLKPTYLDQFLEIAMRVSVFALAAFAMYSAIELFVPFFLAGIAYGIYQNWKAPDITPLAQSSSFCTQGFLEQATGVSFGKLGNLLINVALTAAHIDHLIVYPPIIGAYAGTQLGKAIAPYLHQFYTDHLQHHFDLTYHKITELNSSINQHFKQCYSQVVY